MWWLKDEILEEMKKVTDGVINVIVYPNMSDKTKNRGFAFVEYESHRAAAMARRKLIPGKIQLWNHQIAVDWAEPEPEVDDDVMSRVRISTRDVTKFDFEFDDVRTSNVFTRFEIRRMF